MARAHNRLAATALITTAALGALLGPGGWAADPTPSDLGGHTTQKVSDARSYQMPVANLVESRRELFALSNELFNLTWRAGNDPVDSFDGLGPLFMNNSCSGCHPGNGRGHLPIAKGDKVLRVIA